MRRPELCLYILPSSIDESTQKGEVIAIRFGENGFHGTDYEPQTEEWVEWMNHRLGLSPAMFEAMWLCASSVKEDAWKHFDLTVKALENIN